MVTRSGSPSPSTSATRARPGNMTSSTGAGWTKPAGSTAERSNTKRSVGCFGSPPGSTARWRIAALPSRGVAERHIRLRDGARGIHQGLDDRERKRGAQDAVAPPTIEGDVRAPVLRSRDAEELAHAVDDALVRERGGHDLLERRHEAHAD